MVEEKYKHLPVLIPAEMKPPMTPVHITEESQLELVRSFLSRVTEFGLDTETNVTDTFFDRRIRTIQVGNREEQYVIDLLPFAQCAGVNLYDAQAPSPAHKPPFIPVLGEPHPCLAPILDVLRPALCSNTHLKVGDNLEFEYTMLKWCLGLRIWHLYSIDDAERVMNAGKVHYMQSGFWGMEDITARYIGKSLDKGLQKSFDLVTPLTYEQVVYAALDTRIPCSIRPAQLLALKKDGLMETMQIENDAIPAFGDLHLNGIILNEQKWREQINKRREEHLENIKTLDTYFIPIVGTKTLPELDLTGLEEKWRGLGIPSPEEKAVTGEDRKRLADVRKVARDEARGAFYAARKRVNDVRKLIPDCKGEALINYGSGTQLLKALTQVKGLKSMPDSSDETLKKYAGYGVIAAIRKYRSSEKYLSSYGEDYLSYIDPRTGRVHAHFHRMGALETGRSSCSSPNLQNLPKDKDVRACFEAPEGHVFVITDMSGAELRIIADYGQIKAWIDAFNKKWDVHSVGTEILYPEKWPMLALKGGEILPHPDKPGETMVYPPCAYFTKDHKKCKCPEHMKLRDGNKACNFLLAYGGGPTKLASELGVVLEDAKNLMHLHEQKNEDVWKWLASQGQKAKMTLEARTMAGRRRLFTRPTFDVARDKLVKELKKEKQERPPTQREIFKKMGQMTAGIEREGKNSPIQGSNADMAKKAMGCGFDKDGKPFLWHLMEPKYGARFANFVHDELVYEMLAQHAKEALETVCDAIRRAGAMYLRFVVMEAEGAIDKCWKKG